MTLRRHVRAYDINCQHCIHFDLRMTHFTQNAGLYTSLKHYVFPTTVLGVGKFHLPAHKPSCRWKFSFHYLPGVGMTDGEALERIWSVLNTLGSSTREMSTGHRHDVINDHHSDMNIRRMHSAGELLYLRPLAFLLIILGSNCAIPKTFCGLGATQRNTR